MALPRIDNRTARHLFLDRHLLGSAPAGPGKGADLAQLIHDLGFVQLDSVNTVARAHDMILFARRPAYRPKHLQRLYERDRALFEHWTHDAAMIPMAFFPHWKLRFRRNAAKLRDKFRQWQGPEFEAELETVLEHLRTNGSCVSSDLGPEEPRGSGGWWDWHPSKTALEFLWHTGELGVAGRESFRKRYDLTERLIEEVLRSDEPEEAASIDWLNTAALDRLGFATSGEIAAFWDTVRPDEAKLWCAGELAAERLIEAEIASADGRPRRVFMRPSTLESLDTVTPPPGRLRVLSPFDPALRDRNRSERLFGFHYRIEIFVPEPKRKYGYYVFPLLEGDRLVGRIDMKADRARDVLAVTALWPERGVRWGQGRQTRLDAELQRVARLAGVTQLEFADGWLREPL